MDDLALLVVSCDKYSDLWDIFWILIEKYWNDCTLTKYLGTNYYNYAKNNVRTIQVGEDRSWAENVRKMLEQVQENYVVMMLEDFFIDRRIINEKIKILYDHMVIHGYDCLRLEPMESTLETTPNQSIYLSFRKAAIVNEVIKEFRRILK